MRNEHHNTVKLVILSTVLSVTLPCIHTDLLAQSPSIKSSKSDRHKKAQAILDIMKSYQLSYDIDSFAVDGNTSKTPQLVIGEDVLSQKILDFIDSNEPIQITMVGFPFKSSNHEKKVLSSKPDMAERYSLEYIHGLVTKIKSIYHPGVRFSIISDGSTFNDILGISDVSVEKSLSLSLLIFNSQGRVLHFNFPFPYPATSAGNKASIG